MKTFAVKVDRRSKRAMAEFLAEHFRYDTMNGWNRMTSYANNVKVTRLELGDLEDRALELLDVEATYDSFNDRISDWGAESDYRWQAGFNGRSGGYLVLYSGGRRPSQYKRRCQDCGQRNYRAESTVCGVCHSTNMVDYAGFEVYTNPGGTDDGMSVDDFMELEMYQLRDRVDVVCSFDRLCDGLLADLVWMCQTYEVTEEVVMVPTTRRVLKEVS